MKRLLFVALFPALALAQDRRTAAEELFEKAWWEETASGALDKALDGYRKAADAEGPATIRARSLYRAAIVEQRLGRTDAAVALLERLSKDFASETDLLKEAKSRLQEWTAVDLRKSFSDWYRSYVYSPEFQSRVVDLVLRLGTAKSEDINEVRSQLLTIGEASVPALQEALRSSNVQLCQRATELLLDLGVVPPTEALIRYPTWCFGSTRWLVIYKADEATRKGVREEAKGDEPVARGLRAVATSPDDVLALVVSESNRTTQYLLSLLHRNSGEAVRKRVEGLILEPSVPDHVVSYLRQALPHGPEDMHIARCLGLARTLPKEDARALAASWAVRKLTEKSENDLDLVLALVPASGDGLVSDLATPVFQALSDRHSGTPVLAWTPARAGMLIDLWVRLESARDPRNTGVRAVSPVADELGRVLHVILAEQRGAVAMAEALLDRAPELMQPSLTILASTGVSVQIGNNRQEWRGIFAERAVARWPKLSVEGKVALLGVARNGEMRAVLGTALGDGLERAAVARGTEPALRAAIVRFLGRVNANDLLAAFDLSDAAGARAAVQTLRDLSKNITRDDGTAALLQQILIHGDSATRRVALQLVREWAPSSVELLPAAKVVVGDEAAEMRLWAVNQLAAWNSFEASPYLVKALSDPDADVRYTAAGGLARVGREDAVPALVKLIDDPDPRVRDTAIHAMEQIRRIVDLKKALKLEEAGFR